jgi:hypothetical protein
MMTPVRNFRAPQGLWEAISAAAEGLGVNRSELLRQATAAYGPIQKIIRQESATPPASSRGA